MGVRKVILPKDRPVRCAECPLLGLLPQSERPLGGKAYYVCIQLLQSQGERACMTHDKICKDVTKAAYHVSRPCDDRNWEFWQDTYKGKITFRRDYFDRYRKTYEQSLQVALPLRKPRTTKPKEEVI